MGLGSGPQGYGFYDNNAFNSVLSWGIATRKTLMAKFGDVSLHRDDYRACLTNVTQHE